MLSCKYYYVYTEVMDNIFSFTGGNINLNFLKSGY